MKKQIAWLLAAVLSIAVLGCSAPVKEVGGPAEGSRTGAETADSEKNNPSDGEAGKGEESEPAPEETKIEVPEMRVLREVVRKNKDGNVISRTLYDYDLQGNLLKETNYDKDGKVTYTVVYTYDEKGRELSRSNYEEGEKDPYLYYLWEWDDLDGYMCTSYESDGKPQSIREVRKNAAGVQILYKYESYDEEGNITSGTCQTWDDEGRILTDCERDSYGPHSEENYTYYENGQTATYYRTHAFPGSDRSIFLYEYIYDANGVCFNEKLYTYKLADAPEGWQDQDLIEFIRANGIFSEETLYDEHGNPTVEHDYSKNADTNYQNTYDDKGNLTHRVVSGASRADYTYTYSYHSNGEISECREVNSTLNSLRVFEYDEKGLKTAEWRGRPDKDLVFDREEWEYYDNGEMKVHRVYTDNKDKELYLASEERFNEYGLTVWYHSWHEDGRTGSYYIITRWKDGEGSKMALDDDDSFVNGAYREYDENGNQTYFLQINSMSGKKTEAFYTYDEYGQLILERFDGDEITYVYARLAEIVEA